MHHERDAELVYRCLKGDTDAYGELVQRYQAAVYATAFYYVGRYGTAEDVAQEAFWNAYRALPHLKQPRSFGFWLKEVTTRTAANWLRRNLPRLRHETPLPQRRTISIEDARQGPGAHMERGERFQHVHMAIDALPERYRLPVVLRYLQELSYEEISQFTGESPEEVRGILHRAAKKLREIFKEIDGMEGTDAWRRAHK